MKKFQITKYHATVFDKQCEECLRSVQGLSIEQKLAVLEQCVEYLRTAQADEDSSQAK